MLLPNYFMLDAFLEIDVHNGLVVLWDSIRPNDVVLTLCQPWWPNRRASWRGSMFGCKEPFHQLLRGLLEIDLAEVDNDFLR